MKLRQIIISLLFIFIISASPAGAQEITVATTSSLTPTPTIVNYQLPYPGILPGHPFYSLKKARDNFWGFLISNPLKKAEFDLLQADKSFAAAEILFKRKAKNDVILMTLGEARMYFSDALEKSKAANKQGMDASDLLKRMSVANIRHQSVVYDMTQTNNTNDKKQFAIELDKVKELGKQTSTLLLP